MPPLDESATYLGDGLYAVFSGHDVELYTWNGVTKTNRVFLDGVVLAAFLAYVEQLKKQAADASK